MPAGSAPARRRSGLRRRNAAAGRRAGLSWSACLVRRGPRPARAGRARGSARWCLGNWTVMAPLACGLQVSGHVRLPVSTRHSLALALVVRFRPSRGFPLVLIPRRSSGPGFSANLARPGAVHTIRGGGEDGTIQASGGDRTVQAEEKPMPQAPARRATSESSDVAKLVRLHHRRRGWAWVAIGSVIGLLVYVGIGVNLFENLAGTAETLGVIPVFVLLALVLAGLVVVIVDTSRIHRADAAVRVSAKGSVSHYPLYAHAHRHPPRHRGSWVFAIRRAIVAAGCSPSSCSPR